MQTYNHLFGAILAFVGLELLMFKSGMAEGIAVTLASNWIWVLGAFMLAGWLFSGIAMRVESKSGQYLALGAYVVIEALIFVPLLYIAQRIAPSSIATAGWITMISFGALTFLVLKSKADFSFMGVFLKWIGIIAIVTIFMALIFNVALGLWFSAGMVVFAGAVILYETSNVLHHYPRDRYVAASLGLFASVALMFWYVLQILLSLAGDD